MGNTIYYAAMENTALNNPIFFAGKAQSVDLCSVSACFPHVITYPEPLPASGSSGPGFTGSMESGGIKCPGAPSASNPCTLTVNVNVADVGTRPPRVCSRKSAATASLGGPVRHHDERAGRGGRCSPRGRRRLLLQHLPEATAAASVPHGRWERQRTWQQRGQCSLSVSMRTIAIYNRKAKTSVMRIQEQISIPRRSIRWPMTTWRIPVTIAGLGTNSGLPWRSRSFAVDSSLVAPGMFSITLSDGYTNSGSLLSGSITLH